MLLVNARGVPEMPIQDAVLRVRFIEKMEILINKKKINVALIECT